MVVSFADQGDAGLCSADPLTLPALPWLLLRHLQSTTVHGGIILTVRPTQTYVADGGRGGTYDQPPPPCYWNAARTALCSASYSSRVAPTTHARPLSCTLPLCVFHCGHLPCHCPTPSLATRVCVALSPPEQGAQVPNGAIEFEVGPPLSLPAASSLSWLGSESGGFCLGGTVRWWCPLQTKVMRDCARQILSRCLRSRGCCCGVCSTQRYTATSTCMCVTPPRDFSASVVTSRGLHRA